jgi:hypothetical protein
VPPSTGIAAPVTKLLSALQQAAVGYRPADGVEFELLTGHVELEEAVLPGRMVRPPDDVEAPAAPLPGEPDRRAIACFDQAIHDVGLEAAGPLPQVLYDYFTWATTTTMSPYHESADEVPEGMSIPRWSWDGPQH